MIIMSVIFNIIIIMVCICHNDGQYRGQEEKTNPKKLPFPHLIKFNESDIKKPFFTFEGVDYEQIPKSIFNTDISYCYDELTRCTRFTPYESPVCGYHTYHREIRPYYSICHLDLEGCTTLKMYNTHMYGTSYRMRGVYFIGEGNDCKMFVRRLAEGLVPRDIRDPPQIDSKSYLQQHLQQDATINTNNMPDIEYQDVMY